MESDAVDPTLPDAATEAASSSSATPMPWIEGDTIWQIAFLLLAGMFVLTRVARGAQLGGPRQFMSLLALGGAYAAAIFGGELLIPQAKQLLNFPEFILRVISGAALGIIVWIFFEVLGVVFFPSTKDLKKDRKPDEVDWAAVRFYSASGMVLGLLNACLAIWIAIVLLQPIGRIAEQAIENEFNSKLRDRDAAYEETGSVEAETYRPNKLAVFLAKLRNSISMGPGENVVETVDPIPEQFYDVLEKAVQVMSDPIALQYLAEVPEVKELQSTDMVKSLLNDREIAEMSQERDYIGLLQHKKVVDTADSPEFQDQIKDFDFEGALDQALAHSAKINRSLEEAQAAGELEFVTE